MATRSVRQDFDALRVDRGGRVDWRYVRSPAPSYDGNLLSFEVGPPTISGRVVWPAATGFRLVSLTARGGEPIPVAGARVRIPGGARVRTHEDGRFTLARGRRATTLSVEDRFGNRARVALPPG